MIIILEKAMLNRRHSLKCLNGETPKPNKHVIIYFFYFICKDTSTYYTWRLPFLQVLI